MGWGKRKQSSHAEMTWWYLLINLWYLKTPWCHSQIFTDMTNYHLTYLLDVQRPWLQTHRNEQNNKTHTPGESTKKHTRKIIPMTHKDIFRFPNLYHSYVNIESTNISCTNYKHDIIIIYIYIYLEPFMTSTFQGQHPKNKAAPFGFQVKCI